jgi:hypothetical protein
VRLAFWGFMREKRLNECIIKAVSEDKRFELHFYGRELNVSIKLKDYAKKIGASNVFFHGEYQPEERYEFIKKIDLIHNIYAESTNMMLAMTNKFYDGIIFYVPQICMSGSHMGMIVQEKEIGFSCDPYKKNFLNEVFEYYQHIDRKKFILSCDNCLKKCIEEMDFVKEKVNSTFLRVD